jgi:hypothetical protein
MKKIVTSIITAGLLSTGLYATDIKTQTISNNDVKKAEINAKNDNKLIKEAVLAIKYTNNAYIYLNQKNKKKAIKYLKKAIGELAVILNSPEAPYLLPVDVHIEANEYIGSIENIAKQLQNAKVALSSNQIPLAREILDSLKSEIDIYTTALPLATYPHSLELALRYLNENKINYAKDIIKLTLNSLVNKQIIIPIPILKAQSLIQAASKTKKTQALKELEEAKKQLQIAQLLGYTSKSDTTYVNLKKDIEKIEDKLKGNKKTNILFSELKEKIKEFKEKAISILHK